MFGPLLLTPAACGPQRTEGMKAGRLLSVLTLGLIGAYWSQWFCFRGMGQECMWGFTRTLGQAESEPTSLTHSSAQPSLVKTSVSSYCIFSWENNTQLTRKPVCGGKMVFAFCDTQNLCSVHAGWQVNIEVKEALTGKVLHTQLLFQKALKDAGKAACLPFLIFI